MGRTILSLVLALTVCGSTAFAASNSASSARKKARSLAKEGRNLEAADELRRAAQLVGHEAPTLRFEAALMLQKGGKLQEARALHVQVSTDAAAAFPLRGKARYAAETLFWVLQLESLASPTLERVDKLREQIGAMARRVSEVEVDGKMLSQRLSEALRQVVTTRTSLLPLVGPGDPMVQELDALLKGLGGQKKAMTRLKKGVSDSKKSLEKARKSLAKVNKGIDKLAAYAASQATRAKKGEAKLALIKKHHDALLSGGAKAVKSALGSIDGVGAALRRVDRRLTAATQGANEIDDAVGAAEAVLKGAP